MTTLDIINQIEADKVSRKVAPTHALICEVTDMAYPLYGAFTKQIIISELYQLIRDRVIIIGETINDKYITIL